MFSACMKRSKYWSTRPDPQSRSIVIFASVVCTSVVLSVTTFPNLAKTKQIASENNVYYWQNYVSGPVGHWWHLYCSSLCLCKISLTGIENCLEKFTFKINYSLGYAYCFSICQVIKKGLISWLTYRHGNKNNY